MNEQTPIGSAIAQLKREIAERQSALAILQALVEKVPAPTANGHPPRGHPPRETGLVRAAVAVLKAAGRPMHGVSEVIPALEAQGYRVKHRSGFSSLLLRTGEVLRTAPGTFAYRSVPEDDGAH